MATLVHTFNGKARADALLGPVFAHHVRDWDHHLAQLVDFWSGLLRGTGRYRGQPMPQHIALAELRSELFRRWQALFEEVTAGLGSPALQEKANRLAGMIAERLWHGYQRANRPVQPVQALRAAG